MIKMSYCGKSIWCICLPYVNFCFWIIWVCL